MDKKAIQIAFGMNIKNHRIKCKKSQDEFAYMVNVSTVYLGELERGEKCPSIDIVYKISTSLGVPLAKLLEFETDECVEPEELMILKSALNNIPEKRRMEFASVVEKLSLIFRDD